FNMPSVGPPMLIEVEPMAAKIEATSGCSRNHSSLRVRISTVFSRELPGGVLKRTATKPDSAGGKNSPFSRLPATIASRIDGTAIAVVFQGLAMDQSSTLR